MINVASMKQMESMDNADTLCYTDLDTMVTYPASHEDSVYPYETTLRVTEIQDCLKTISHFENSDVLNWRGKECLDWACQVCHEQGINQRLFNFSNFGLETGAKLATYSKHDFCSQFDVLYGSIFYDEFQKLLHRQGIEVCGLSYHDNHAYGASPNYSDSGSEHNSDYGSENSDMILSERCSWELPTLHTEDLHELDSCLDFKQENTSHWGNSNITEVLMEPVSLTSGYAPYIKEEDLLNLDDTSYDCESNISEASGSSDPDYIPVEEPESPVGSLVVPQGTTFNPLTKIKTKSRKRVRGPKNWEFVIRLLVDKDYNPEYIRWEDRATNTFRFVKPTFIAQMWGQRAGKPKLSYDNFARGLRYHYTTGALHPVSERQLVYRCGPKAIEFLNNIQKGAY